MSTTERVLRILAAGERGDYERISALCEELCAVSHGDPTNFFFDSRFETHWASSAREALAMLGEARFDILFADLTHPEFSRAEGIARLHAFDPLLPIVVLSNHTRSAEGLEASRYGAQDCLYRGTLDLDRFEQSVRYALERSRAVARREASAASRHRALAEMASHVKTPVASIVGFARLLHEQDAAQIDLGDACGSILRSAQQLLSIVDELRDLAKIEPESVEIRSEQCSLEQLLNDIHTTLAPRAEEQGVVLKLQCAPVLPEYLHTDQARAKQVLLQLAGNSILASAGQAVIIEVGYEAEHDRIRVQVGCPGGAAALPGPSLCKQLTAVLGGELTIDQRGSMVTVLLPRSTRPFEDTETAAAISPPASIPQRSDAAEEVGEPEFIARLPGILGKLRAFLQCGQWRALELHAHRLLSADRYGLAVVAKGARLLEQAAVDASSGEGFTAMRILEEAIEHAVREGASRPASPQVGPGGPARTTDPRFT